MDDRRPVPPYHVQPHALAVNTNVVPLQNHAVKRLLRESAKDVWQAGGCNGLALQRIGNNVVVGAVVISAASPSPFAGGLFYFEFLLAPAYPFKAPSVRLLTRALHAGVCQDGGEGDPP